jgi:hypothetical protein
MLDANIAMPISSSLRDVLEESSSGVSDAAIAAASSLGPELAGDTVASLVESELARPTGGRTAIVATHLARELRLTRAVPALVRCLEVLPGIHPLGHAALGAVARFGAQAVDALIASFDRCTTPEGRARIAEALSRTAIEDDRIRSAFVRMLEDDPVNGAGYLAEYGDWRAVADLARTLDRIVLMPLGDCDLCSSEHLIAIASAIRVLGGTLSDAQRTKIDEVLQRGDELWVDLEDSFASLDAAPPPVTRGSRAGRNAPCHCGSGKKYKKCHLEADERLRQH